MKKQLLSIITCLALCLCLAPLLAAEAEAVEGHAAHCVCGKESSETVEGHTHSASMPEWTETATLSNNMSAGYYYLTANVQLSDPWTPADGTVLCLNGHTITAPSDSYAVYVGNKFTLTDCSDDKKEGYLDGFYLWHAGEPEETTVAQKLEYDLTGGVITGAGDTTCGAIYVAGTFEMYGGNIAGNDKKGGVMAVSDSEFTMYGGKVCGNHTNNNGGGVHLFNATFTMHGGEIAYNHAVGADALGGGVYVCNGAEFIMSGQAKVVGNCNYNGGGIYVDTGGTAELSGNASVAENKSGGFFGSAIYSFRGGTVTLKDNASVTKNERNGIYGYPGSTITLNGCTGTIHVTNNTENGIRTSGTLILNGCADNPGSILISGNTFRGIWVESNGSLTMSNSTISENKTGGMKVEGSFAISASRISGNIGDQGAGIYIAGDGSVTNTQITGNKARGNNLAGGGIYIGPNGKARISGGQITGNSADRFGGGIWLYSSNNLQLAGAVNITGNIVNGSEENLFFFSPEGKKTPIVQIGVTDEAGNTEYLTGDAKIGVSHISTPTEDTPLALTKENGADYSRYFFSDKPAYGIYNGDDNKVMLGVNKTITYDANGGSGVQEPDACLINGTFTLPESTTFTPPDGKKFKGWSLSENGEIIKTHKISGNTIFYAIWYDYIVEVTGVEAATGLVYNGSPQQGYTADNIVSGGYIGAYTATYAGANGTSYGPSTTAPTNAGDYTVTLSIPADATYGGYEYAGESAPVAFTIGKAASSVGSAPTAINPAYNGTAQDLVTAGEATGGEMRYAVGTDSTTAPTTGWSTTIPTSTNAGTYYVWYKVVGDENHNDLAPVCIEAEIEKAILDVSAKDHLLAVNSPAPDLTSADAYTITGFVSNETTDVITGVPVLSYAFGESPDMGEEGYYSIEVDTDGMSADNYNFNAISGELQVVNCVHDFTEFSVSTSADGTVSSILAKCNNSCDEFAQPAAIITITAPEDPVYSQGEEHTASLIYDSQVQMSSEDIVYSGTPTNAGTYTASVTYSGQTASVTYTVAPRPLTIKADNKSVYVNGSEPEYTYTVTGWDGSHDDEDPYSHQLSGVTAICADADLTKTGSYTITLSGTPKVEEFDSESKADVSANYSFILENGTLTVRNQTSSGGGGSYTPPVQNVTVPISGDENTIHVDAEVKGDKATVDHVDLDHLDEVIGDHVDTGTVTIDFSGLDSKEPITTVEIPASAVKEIAAAVSDPNNDAHSFEVVLPDGLSIEFDAVALGEKAAQADGLDITISIEHHHDAELTNAQKNAVGDRPAYDINVTSGGKHISDMGGKITVHAPYELKAGEKARGIVVWYVDDHGNRERCETRYDPIKQRVNWKTDHLSLYMIDYDEALANNPFTDISENAYYFDAVLWAYGQGITGGTGATSFSPNAACTRAQMATFLWRAAGSPDPVGKPHPFTDIPTNAYYAKAVQWAYEQGITVGTSATAFTPDASCTRAQMATFLYRNEQASGGGFTGAWMFLLPFTDTPEWAYEAIAWCYKEGITNGTGDGTTFSPDDPCTRAQMVTFLYRSFGE